jgi:hypothetical protein
LLDRVNLLVKSFHGLGLLRETLVILLVLFDVVLNQHLVLVDLIRDGRYPLLDVCEVVLQSLDSVPQDFLLAVDTRLFELFELRI